MSSSLGPISPMIALSTYVFYHLHTVFLFTRSDYITTIVPMVIFALGTAPICATRPVENATMSVFWLWLVLLQFNFINQTASPEEDRVNKPWRPIPSGRISLQTAITARWISILACSLVSSYFGTPVLVISVAFTFLALLYSVYDGASDGFLKNLISGLEMSLLALGTTLVAACGTLSPSETLNWRKFPQLTLLFCIYSTTAHAQDFRDVEGDQLIGRKTIPMIIPETSRVSMLVFLPAWSVAIAVLFDLPAWMVVGYFTLSMAVGLRFFFMRRSDDDIVSYNLYNVWLSLTILSMVLFKGVPSQNFLCSTPPPLVPISHILAFPKCVI